MPSPGRFNRRQPARILGHTFLHVDGFAEFITVVVFPPGAAARAFGLVPHPDPDPEVAKAMVSRHG